MPGLDGATSDEYLHEHYPGEWVAFVLCPTCGTTWKALKEGERPGAFGCVLDDCPECAADKLGPDPQDDPFA